MDEISKINTVAKFNNPDFAINFAVDNNPVGIFEQLKLMGFGALLTGNITTDKSIAKQLIFNWYQKKDTANILNLLNNVSYVNDGENSLDYTKGFRDYFAANSPTVNESQYRGAEDASKFSIDGLLAALGTGLTTYSSIAGQGTGFSTPEQQAAAKAEEEAKAKRKTWLIIGSIVLGLAIIGIIVAVNRNKKS